jgi:hypothetical protein
MSLQPFCLFELAHRQAVQHLYKSKTGIQRAQQGVLIIFGFELYRARSRCADMALGIKQIVYIYLTTVVLYMHQGEGWRGHI